SFNENLVRRRVSAHGYARVNSSDLNSVRHLSRNGQSICQSTRCYNARDGIAAHHRDASVHVSYACILYVQERRNVHTVRLNVRPIRRFKPYDLTTLKEHGIASSGLKDVN